MSFDYLKAQQTASRLIARFGTPVVVSRVVPGGYDPDTGLSPGSTQTWQPVGVMLDYEAREIDGTLIRAGDQRVYMSAVPGLDPQAGDTVTISGNPWRVESSKTLAPAGLAVLLDVQVRKG